MKNVPSWLAPRIADDSDGEVSYSSETSSQQVFDRLAGAWTYWDEGGFSSEDEQVF